MALDPSKNMYLCTKFVRTMNILSKSSIIFKSLYLGGGICGYVSRRNNVEKS